MKTVDSFINNNIDEVIEKNKQFSKLGLNNMIIQGLPGSGLDQVFDGVVQHLKDVNDNVILIDASNFRVRSAATCLYEINKLLVSKEPSLYANIIKSTDLSEIIENFRDLLEKYTDQNKKIIFVIYDFDAFLRAKDSEGLQHIFNVWQVVGSHSSGKISFFICCNRDIEEICAYVSYSNFDKIFGTNRFRVSNNLDENSIREKFGFDDKLLKEIIAASGGFYDHIKIIHEMMIINSFDWKKRCLESFIPNFEKWNSLLSSEEMKLVILIANNTAIPIEFRFTFNNLIRKGLIIEEPIRIKSDLFSQYLIERVGTEEEGSKPFIREWSRLPDPIHFKLMSKLCSRWALVEWKLLQQPRPEEATVYKLEGEDAKGIKFRPVVMKLHKVNSIDKEIESLKQAKERLGIVVPGIIKEEVLQGHKAILLEYASGENVNYTVNQFEDYYLNSDSNQVEDLLKKVFSKVLFPLYENQVIKELPAKNSLFLPRLHLGEWDEISRLIYKTQFWDNEKKKLEIPHIFSLIEDPGKILKPNGDNCLYYKIFVKKRNYGYCDAHGDLNPRNLLIDGIGNIYMIDFPLLKENALRFTDAARLEVEIRFKMAVLEHNQSWIALDVFINKSSHSEIKSHGDFPLTDDAKKLLKSISAIRESVFNLALNSGGLEEELLIEYNIVLLAQILRISLFEDYLNEGQKKNAVLSAAVITHFLSEKLSTS